MDIKVGEVFLDVHGYPWVKLSLSNGALSGAPILWKNDRRGCAMARAFPDNEPTWRVGRIELLEELL